MKRVPRQRWALLAGALGMALGLFGGCGPPDVAGGGGGTGPICYEDTDCVPNGCCGSAADAVEKSQGPDCSKQTCDANVCAQTNWSTVKCGCGLPTCRDSHCTVALSQSAACQ